MVLGQVEAQAVRDLRGLRHGLRVIGGEASRHRLRRREHMAEVAAPQWLGGVERRAVTDRDERILQRRTGAHVSVDVAGRDRAQLQLACERGDAAVARAVVAQVGALQLDAQAVGRERIAQRLEARAVVDPVRGAAAEADQAVGVVEHGGERDVRLRGLAWARAGGGPPARPRVPRRAPLPHAPRVREPCRLVPARVSMRAGQEPAEVAPPALVLDEQRQVAAVLERQLGAVQRPQPDRLARLRVLHRAADVVVVGQRERLVPQLGSRDRQLVRQRGAVEEREGGMGVQLDIGHEHMFDDHIHVGYHRKVEVTGQVQGDVGAPSIARQRTPPDADDVAARRGRCCGSSESPTAERHGRRRPRRRLHPHRWANQAAPRRSWKTTTLRPQVVTTSQ